MNKERMPWSRIAVVSYLISNDERSDYGRVLGERRAKEIATLLSTAGLQPRRIEAQATFIDAPLVIDPNDDPLRYGQAIEFIPLDRGIKRIVINKLLT